MSKISNELAKKKEIAETPLMKQYNTIKAKYPDALLLFRVGDFYETFGEDAIVSSRILGIVLTRRANGAAAYIELAGFPHHSIDTYLPKLVRAGYRVAICDQLEDPKLTKKIVKRGVTELVTPGVSYNDKVLEQKENNFLASIHFDAKESGISFLDISTGEFFVAQGNEEYIDKLIQSFKPSEVVVQRNKRDSFKTKIGDKIYINTFDDWVFTTDFAYDILIRHFQTKSLKGFGIEHLEKAVIAAGAAMHYLAETHHDKVSHIGSISRIEEDDYVWLDRFTIRNLELLYSPNEGATTLIDVMDKTITPMGSRLLKRWIALPLKNKKPLIERYDIVEFLIQNTEFSVEVAEYFKQINDLERLISKVAVGRINPREVVQMSRALHAVESVKSLCEGTTNKSVKRIAKQLDPCKRICKRIEQVVNEDAPALIAKGNVIMSGVSKELDQLRNMAFSGKDFLERYSKKRNRTDRNLFIENWL